MSVTANPPLRDVFPPGRFEFTPREPLSDDEFFDLCQRVAPHQLERDPDGTILVMPPAGSYSSSRSNEIAAQLRNWVRETESGASFDSSGGFRLPNGAIRAPDAAWVRADRLAELDAATKERFLPLAPDFAVEVRSPSDARADLETKMTEYVAGGTRLAWLVDPQENSVTVYRDDGSTERFDEPDTLSAAPVLPGFSCDFTHVWDPGY
jgi:Uma2 family endonuclease